MIKSLPLACLLLAVSSPLLAEQPTVPVGDSSKGQLLWQASAVDGQRTLLVGEQTVSATYLQETLGQTHGGVLLLHDLDGQIDSHGPIANLRRQLPAHGWSTMTVALHFPPAIDAAAADANASGSAADSDIEAELTETPVDTAEPPSVSEQATEPEAEQQPEAVAAPSQPADNQQRIRAALDALDAENLASIIVLAHGRSAADAVALLSETDRVDGLILLSVAQLEQALLTESGLPILELLAERDTALVKSAAQQRQAAMKREAYTNYRQQQLAGTDRSYQGSQPVLLARVRAWLQRQFVEQAEL